MRSIFVLAILLLGGCQRDVDVTARALPDGRVIIEATATRGAEPCVDIVFIAEGAGGRTTIWQLHRMESGMCRNQFVYPEVPEGYVLDTASAPLAAGREYLAGVNGPGFSADALVVVDRIR